MVLRAQWPLGTIAQFFHFVAEEKKRRQKNKGILWLGYYRYPSNNQSSNPDFPWDSYGPFDLENIDEAECKAEFRVEKRDLPTLREVLGIPPAFKCPQRTICDGMEGLCMLLKRLAYPCRYSDMITRFGRPVPELCMITNWVMDFIWCTWPPNHSVEWHYTESRINWTICHCHHRKRRSSRQLFWLCWWYRTTDLQTRRYAENRLQWAQESTCSQVSVGCHT